MIIRHLAKFFLALSIWAQSASATTIFFGDLSDRSPMTENGFEFQNSINYNIGGQLYLHDDGGIITTSFRHENGRSFNVYDAIIRGYSKLFKVEKGKPLLSPDGNYTNGIDDLLSNNGSLHATYQPTIYYSMEGFRDGTLVASLTQRVPQGDFQFQPVNWGNLFTNLDMLVISLKLPADRRYVLRDQPPYKPGQYVCLEWCGGFQLTKLRVDVVPLPASAPMLAGGLAMIGLMGWRRRLSRA